MNRWGRAAVSGALIGWLGSGGAAQAGPGPYVPAAGTCSQAGPQAVTEQIGFGCFDSTGAKYDIRYPTDPGTSPHPIAVWGDGTWTNQTSRLDP